MSLDSLWVPDLTSDAGLCLTAKNWQEIYINSAVYYLDALLLKPGSATLKAVSDLASYVNWSGALVVNASRFKANREGVITLISPYDGSKIKLDCAELIDLINHLNPAMVILPPNILKDYPQIWDNWNTNIKPYVSAAHLTDAALPESYGVYFTFTEYSLDAQEQLEAYQHVSRYVQGPLSLESIQAFNQLNIPYIESNEPAKLGLNGLVYSFEGVIDLKDEQYAMQFNTISSACECCTCTAQLTKAYLHHLYLHTPLLCQRFLIQHNGYYVQKSLIK